MTDIERLTEMHSRVDFLLGKQEAHSEQIVDILAEQKAVKEWAEKRYAEIPADYDAGNLENPPVVKDDFYEQMLEAEVA